MISINSASTLLTVTQDAATDGEEEVAGPTEPSKPPPQYIFSSLSSHMSTDSSLHETILHMDPIFVDWNKMLKNSPQFYLGSPGTGAPVHFHTHAYNVLIHGRKKWALIPPRAGLYSTVHINEWQHTKDYAYGARFPASIYARGCHWVPTPARLKRACV
jgi:hypothetical protein